MADPRGETSAAENYASICRTMKKLVEACSKKRKFDPRDDEIDSAHSVVIGMLGLCRPRCLELERAASETC